MKTSIKYILTLTLLIAGLFLPQGAWAISGDGTSSSPYQISSASDWSTFRTAVNGRSKADTPVYAKLTGSFTISSGAYTPVGTSSKPFYGKFNGQGYTITLSNAQSSSNDFGLFGYAKDATILDLKVSGTITISGSREHLGGVVGQIQGSTTIAGCSFTGTLDAGSSYNCVGGIAGYANNTFSGSIKYCFSKATFKTKTTDSTPTIGGILGYFNDENTKKPTIQYNFADCEYQWYDSNSNLKSSKYFNGIIGRIRAHADNLKNNYYISKGNITRACNNDSDASISSTNTSISISVTAGSNGSASWEYVYPTSSAMAKLQATASPSSHYVFDKWTSSSSSSTSISTSASYSVALSSSVSLYANFKRDSHTITVVSANTNMGTVSGGGTYTHGATPTLTASPTTGYHFVQWNDGNTNASRTVTVTADATYTATFAINTYTVTVKSNGNGTVAKTDSNRNADETYNHGKQATITATPATGYHFVKWNDGNTNASRTVTVTANATYTATFAINTYAVTVQSNGNGTAAKTDNNRNADGTYNHGKQATIKATPATGYSFDYWMTGSTKSSTNPLSFTVTSAITYKAYFKINQYTITAKSNNNNFGTVTGGGTYDYNTQHTLTATPAEHYHFVSWSEGTGVAQADGSNQLAITVPASDKEYTATFAIDQFQITATANDKKLGSVTGVGTYDYHATEKVELTATPTEFGEFVQWNDGNTDNPRLVSRTADLNLVAEFLQIAPCHNQIMYTTKDDLKVGLYSSSGMPEVVSNVYDSEKKVGFMTFKGDVTSIGNYAFSCCVNLEEISIPNSVTSIGDYAFRYCVNLEEISIPNSVTSIGYGAFEYCCVLEKNYVNNSGLEAKGLIIADSEQSDGLMIKGSEAVFCRRWATDVTIPNSVTSIGTSAFRDCSSLTTVTIPNSVTSIGPQAFYICSSLESISIPNSVTSIGDDAFLNCTSLTSVTIPNSVTSIGTSAFQHCTSLTSVTIPNSVTSIGDYAFDACSSLPVEKNIRYADTYLVGATNKNLSEYTIKEGTRFIGIDAFKDCSSLTNVTIPNSVTSIGNYAFQLCSNLESVDIPNSVTSIGVWAFANCSNLESVDIPNSVTSIGECAFGNCSSLTSVKFQSIPEVDDFAFDEVPSTCQYTLALSDDSYVAIGGNAICNDLASATYSRKVTGEWDTWYMPFEVTLTDEMLAQYDFARINNVHQYDDDNDGVPDRTEVESFRLASGASLRANYPYLVKARPGAPQRMLLDLDPLKYNDPAVKSIDCQSADYRYTFTGTYDNFSNPLGIYSLTASGNWEPVDSVPGQHHYLQIASLNANSSSQAAPLRIQLTVLGEEEDTGLGSIDNEQLTMNNKLGVSYNLQGQRQSAKRSGLQIVNGKVVYIK